MTLLDIFTTDEKVVAERLIQAWKEQDSLYRWTFPCAEWFEMEDGTGWFEFQIMPNGMPLDRNQYDLSRF